jgi:hypothetical protein
MSKHHPVSTILILVGPDKVSHQTRYDRGVRVTAQAPQSPLYQQHSDLKGATDEVIKENVVLGNLIDAYAQADAAFKKARTALDAGTVTWDGIYDVFVNTTEKYGKTPDDAASVGTQARPRTHYSLLAPVSLEMKDDAKKDRLVIRVHRAPGMKRTVVEVNNTDPANAAAWKELDSSGALHYVPGPAKGTWWARAASRTAKEKSAFCAPVSIVVR